MQAEGAGTSPVPSARKNQGTRLSIVGRDYFFTEYPPKAPKRGYF